MTRSLIVRRPFLLDSSRIFERGAGQPVFDSLELSFERLNFLMLSEYHIAEFRHRVLEIGDFHLHPFERIVDRRQRFAP